MRTKIIISAVLIVSFITLVSFAGTIQKDGKNLSYIPYFTSDNTPETITISGIDAVNAGPIGEAFVSDVLYKYLVKYESNPTNTYRIDTNKPINGSVDENGTYKTTYYIQSDKNTYKVTYSTDPEVWINVTISNTTNNYSYTELKNIAVSRF